MFMDLFKWFKKSEFPKTVKNYWYCGVWYMHCSENNCKSADVVWPIEGKVLFNHFQVDFNCSDDDSRLIDGLIPAIRNGNRVGLYKVTSHYRMMGGSDLACWDNGMEIDLKLVKVIG